MTPETPWISCAERMPTEADWPVWYANIEKQNVWGVYYSSIAPTCTHWKHAKDAVPAAPKPVVKTQHEKDEEASKQWRKQQTTYPTPNCAWHAACAYARSSTRKEIGERLGEIIAVSYGSGGWAEIIKLERELTEGAK